MVRKHFVPFALLFGFLALASAPLAAQSPAADPACPAAALSLALAAPGAPEAAFLPDTVPAPSPAAACPTTFCAVRERECLRGCPCGFLICDPVACTSQCVCPIFCPPES